MLGKSHVLHQVLHIHHTRSLFHISHPVKQQLKHISIYQTIYQDIAQNDNKQQLCFNISNISIIKMKTNNNWNMFQYIKHQCHQDITQNENKQQLKYISIYQSSVLSRYNIKWKQITIEICFNISNISVIKMKTNNWNMFQYFKHQCYQDIMQNENKQQVKYVSIYQTSVLQINMKGGQSSTYLRLMGASSGPWVSVTKTYTDETKWKWIFRFISICLSDAHPQAGWCSRLP